MRDSDGWLAFTHRGRKIHSIAQKYPTAVRGQSRFCVDRLLLPTEGWGEAIDPSGWRLILVMAFYPSDSRSALSADIDRARDGTQLNISEKNDDA
jgi:hypothetical protein